MASNMDDLPDPTEPKIPNNPAWVNSVKSMLCFSW
jgi:hypothetical protein